MALILIVIRFLANKNKRICIAGAPSKKRRMPRFSISRNPIQSPRPAQGLAPFRIQPVRVNGTTPCSGDDSSPCNGTNTTRAGEWYHLSACHPDRMKRAEGSTQVASFTLCWYIIQRGGFLHSACAPVGMTYLKGGFVYPHRFYLQRGGRQIAAPTVIHYVFDILQAQNDDRHIENMVIRNKTTYSKNGHVRH